MKAFEASFFPNNCLCVVARYADLKTRAEHVTTGITKLEMELSAADLHGFNFLCFAATFSCSAEENIYEKLPKLMHQIGTIYYVRHRTTETLIKYFPLTIAIASSGKQAAHSIDFTRSKTQFISLHIIFHAHLKIKSQTAHDDRIPFQG